MARHPGRTALYRLYDSGGALLYVGIAHNPDQRWATHSLSKAWWTAVDKRLVEWHDTRASAERAEIAAIRTEKPLHNVTGTPATSLTPVGGKTPTRPIRVGLDVWASFGIATKAMGEDRSSALRAFMAWYCAEPEAELPERPARSDWAESEPPKTATEDQA